MPAFAQTNPCRVRVISTPRSARSTSVLSSSTSCTMRGSLPSLRASSRARSTAHVASRTQPALRLRDHLLATTTTSPRPIAAPRRRDQRREVVARLDLRHARERLRASRSVMPAARRERRSALSTARVRDARPCARSSARRVASSPVSTSSASDGTGSTSWRRPSRSACSTWRSQRARAELRLERAAAGRARARWCRSRGGRARSRRRRLRAGRTARVELAGVDQRAVAGHQQRALVAERGGARQPDERGRGLALLARRRSGSRARPAARVERSGSPGHDARSVPAPARRARPARPRTSRPRAPRAAGAERLAAGAAWRRRSA